MHEEHVLLTVKAKKHVLVEKPMAINLARASSPRLVSCVAVDVMPCGQSLARIFMAA